MNKKKILIVIGIAIAIFIAARSFIFQGTEATVHHDETHHGHEHEMEEDHHDHNHDHVEKKEIKLTPEQIERFNLQTQKLTKNNFQHRLTFPGQIVLNENKITHVVASVPGTVKEIFKGLGEITNPGEPLATLQSREMAEAKSDYIAAYKNLILKKELMEREEKLWKQNIKAEIQFIQTRNVYEIAKIELEQAKQKLLALNMTEEQIQKLPEQKNPLNIYTINAPMNGKIIERHITPGEIISTDKQVFVIANLDTVWINLAIPAEDLPTVKKNQIVEIYAYQGQKILKGTIMYVSPVINDESRTGKAIIELENKDHTLHPGDFVKAQVVVSENPAFLSLPSKAIQKINGQPFVFVKTNDNTFEAKPVQIKGSDKGEFVEIIDGIHEGDEIIINNSFFLKAELGKSGAEHSH